MAGAGSDARSVAITGADGFIGRALVAQLVRANFDVRAVTRASHGDLAAIGAAQLAESLRGVDAVFHLAARAHVMRENAPDPVAAFHAANVTATEHVARAALEAGVRRFVHASTAKINGETNLGGRPFRIGDSPNPQDAYARSKLQAEKTLRDIAADSTMSVVALRLPLVYGAGVRGNFLALWDAVARLQWLPFAAIDNRRSMIGLGNLVNAFEVSIDAPAGTYFVTDPFSVSTPQLVRAMAVAQQVEANLAYVPVAFLRAAGGLIGRRAAIERLTSSLEIDSAPFCHASGWQPRYTLAEGLTAIISQ